MISSYDKVVTMIKLLYSLLTLKCAFVYCSISKNVEVTEISKWKNDKKAQKSQKRSTRVCVKRKRAMRSADSVSDVVF